MLKKRLYGLPKQRQQSARQCNVFTVPNVAQKQRSTEQAIRDAVKQEAVEVYKTFSKLDLEIVVDVRSFTITHIDEPEVIVLPETPHSCSSTNEAQKPVLIAPALHTRMRGIKSHCDKTKISKVVAGKKHQSVFLTLEQILF